MKEKKNSDLKKVYNTVFKDGYEKVYTSFITNNTTTPEIEEVLKEDTWKGKKVVDVGCGDGAFVFVAAQLGADVLGIDYIESAIQGAQKKYQHENLEYRVCDAKELEGKYDVIVSIGTLEHMDDPYEMLALFKKRLNKNGKIIITSPNWTNPRGYVLMTLYHLFNAPITLADLHYLTPKNFINWANKMKMTLKWRTFDHSWGHGQTMIKDFKKRLPNVLRDAKLPNRNKNIESLISWLEEYVVPIDDTLPESGALGIYIFKK